MALRQVFVARCSEKRRHLVMLQLLGMDLLIHMALHHEKSLPKAVFRPIFSDLRNTWYFYVDQIQCTHPLLLRIAVKITFVIVCEAIRN